MTVFHNWHSCHTTPQHLTLALALTLTLHTSRAPPGTKRRPSPDPDAPAGSQGDQDNSAAAAGGTAAAAAAPKRRRIMPQHPTRPTAAATAAAATARLGGYTLGGYTLGTLDPQQQLAALQLIRERAKASQQQRVRVNRARRRLVAEARLAAVIAGGCIRSGCVDD